MTQPVVIRRADDAPHDSVVVIEVWGREPNATPYDARKCLEVHRLSAPGQSVELRTFEGRYLLVREGL